MKDRIAVDQGFPLASASLPSSSAPLNSFSNCRRSGSSDHELFFVIALGGTMAFGVVMALGLLVLGVMASGVMAFVVVALGETMVFGVVMAFVAMVAEVLITALGVMAALEVMTFVALVLEVVMTALGITAFVVMVLGVLMMVVVAFGLMYFGVIPAGWVVLLLPRRVPQVSSSKLYNINNGEGRDNRKRHHGHCKQSPNLSPPVPPSR
jgi:hypothetical protein